MQVKQRHNNVQQGGVQGERTGFRIAMNAKMFKTLSDSLYQDKPGSIVREIVCNAVDAHRMAGKPDEPVEVHLPNALEPWLSVKDEGVGLSDESVRHIYSTYGESTKDQSNDQIGAFGLGSKTPFAYTDQFTVTSIYDGVKRIYIAVIGDDGMPHISLQSESETDEHAGLEVTIAVQHEDCGAFHKAVCSQLRFLPVRPRLTNNLDGIEFMDMDANVKIKNDLVTVYENTGNFQYGASRYNYINDLWVTQGGVGYPLDLDRLGDMPKETRAFADVLDNMGAIIDFPIGEIEVTASREGISYESDTIANIIRRLSEVAVSLCDEAVTEIEAESSHWMRAQLYNAQINVVQRALRENPKFDTLFEGFALEPHSRYNSSPDMVLELEELDALGFGGVFLQKYTYTRRHTYDQGVRIRRLSIVGPESSAYRGQAIKLAPQDDIQIFVRDTNSKPVARVKMYCESNNYPPLVMIEPEKFDGEVDDAAIKKIAKAMRVDASAIKKLSSLPAPATKGRTSDKRPRAYLYDHTRSDHSSTRSMEWIAQYEKVDDLDAGVYIPMDRHYLVMSVNHTLFMACIKHGKIDLPVYAVNQQTATKIAEGKIGHHMITVEEALEQVWDDITRARSIASSINKYKGFNSGMRDGMLTAIMDKVGRSSIGNVSIVSKRIAMLQDRIGDWEFAANITTTEHHTGFAAGEKRSVAFYEKYPLLRHIRYKGYFDDAVVNDAVEYIKLVDKGA